MVRNWQMLLADTLTIGVVLNYPTKEVLAQNITTDGTLGTPKTLTGPNYNIPQSLGQTVNSNLFHSFGKFNLNSNEAAIFQSGNEINNIFSRVTGGSPSSINGLIRTLGQNVNLFFLNPNGIIFGANASLDVSGSFLATTADSFVFGDGLEFSATNPQSAPLLTVNFTPGLQYGRNNPSRTIENQGNLTVGSQQRLTLAGNKVTSTGSLTTSGGRVELLGTESVALSENATIDVSSPTGGGIILIGGDFQGKGTIPNAQRTYVGNNVTINADALINGNGGRVIVWADEVTGFYGSISAKGGLDSGNGGLVEVSGKEHLIFRGTVNNSAVNGLPGTLLLDPTNIIIADGTGDEAGDGTDTVAGNNSGVAGSILSAPLSEIDDTAPTTIYESELERLSGDTNIVLQATNDIRLQDLSDNGLELAAGAGGIALSADADGDGLGNFVMEDAVADTIFTNGRDLEISGVNLTLSNIDTTVGNGITGNGGEVTLNSTGEIDLNGIVDTSSNLGDGGDVSLSAQGNIIINPGASIFASGLLGGSITVASDGDISLAGGGIISDTFTAIPENISGSINISAKSLSLSEGSAITALSFGRADGGDIIIIAESFSMTDFSILAAVTFDRGDAGSILVKVDGPVFLSGDSNIFNQVAQGAISSVGGITIESGSLSLTEGAELVTSTDGQGNAGNVTIQVSEHISFDGVGDSGFASGIFATVFPNAVGRGGDITLKAGSLSITDGARIQTKSEGQGDTGNVTIEVRDPIFFDGAEKNPNPAVEHLTGIFTTVQTSTLQQGGDIEINAGSLSIINGAELTANTFGLGNSGNIMIEARDSISLDGINNRGSRSGIFSAVGRDSSGNVGKGQGGDIQIAAKSLALNNGAAIASATEGQGDAGKVTIITRETVSLDVTGSNKVFSFITTSVEPEAIGNANDIDITTKLLTVTNGAQLSASTLGEGKAGSITITANTLEAIKGGQLLTTTSSNFSAGDIILRLQDNLLLLGSHSGLFAQTSGAGDAGKITINTPQLSIDQGASISAFTEAAGDGGTITIIAPQTVLLTDNSKLTVETSEAGKPGDIIITTPNLTIGKDAEISATATTTSTNTERGGSITVNASNLDLTGKLGIFAETQGEAPAGILNIQPDNSQPNLDIQFSDTAIISASTTASGKGGDINLTAPETINITGQGKIAVETTGTGDAGSINITTENFNISNQTEISASTFNSGKAGNINITADNFNLREGATVISNTASSGQAGDIQLQIRDNLNLVNSTIAASTAPNSTGKSGSINIDPQTVTVTNSQIAVNSQGQGMGGEITLQAESLTLDQGSITAETASNQGGNITLNIGNTLTFENNGEITASAGTAQKGGNGGNIKINADFVLAFPSNNTYKITAEAFKGDGGNIEITTNSFFGREFVDISASSQFGLEGDVSIDILEVNPARGLTKLPADVIDASQQITQGCTLQESGRFVATGRGGLPLSPNEPLRGTAVITNWVDEPTETSGKVNNQLAKKLSEDQSNSEIIEAQGWVINARGNVELITKIPANPAMPINISCNTY